VFGVLSSLPPELKQLVNLQTLDLSSNQLSSLPPEIGQLVNLQSLDLGSNQLSSLPPEFGQLKNLETLDLENNNLTNLPSALQKLTKLKKLNLLGEGNAQLQIPPEILGDSRDKLGEPAKILSFYFPLQAEPEKPLNEAKLLLVGQGSVGNQLITQWRGILNHQQLNRILRDPCYPSDKQLFIVEMMQKFELCFPLENSSGENHFLIPDLLPKEEPATGEWENVLAFQYHYKVLPNSIISRFIVRMHHLADRQTWWRSGIVLKYKNNRALVKCDREDKKIFISISGQNSTRRELLTKICEQFEAIHQTIKGLKAEGKVPIPNQPEILVDYNHLLTLEKLGEKTFIPVGLGERVSIQELLNGIEPITIQPEFIPEPIPEKYEKEIFISYAWSGDSETYVNRLDEVLKGKGITIIRDKRDLVYKGLIKAFMEKIGRGKCVIAVISDKYLKSPNCMFELVQIAKNGEFYHRIFPIVLADAQIYKPIERIKYIKHWEDEIEQLEEAIKSVSPANLQGLREEIDQYTEIRKTIAELTNLLKDMNTLTPDIHSDSEFEELLQAIANRLDE
jgi:GTPase SAR1 family protein